MGLSPQAFSPKKEGIDENHRWVTDDGFPLNPPRHCVGGFCALSGIPGFILNLRDVRLTQCSSQRQIIYIFTCPFHAKAGPALELSSSSNPHLQPWYFFLPTRPLFFYLWRQSSHSPYPFLPTTPFLYPSSFIAIIYQWRIQDFQNRGGDGRTPGMWGFFWCPPPIPMFFSDSREWSKYCKHCMVTSMKVYACNTVKTKQNKISNRGRMPVTPVLDPPFYTRITNRPSRLP